MQSFHWNVFLRRSPGGRAFVIDQNTFKCTPVVPKWPFIKWTFFHVIVTLFYGFFVQKKIFCVSLRPVQKDKERISVYFSELNGSNQTGEIILPEDKHTHIFTICYYASRELCWHKSNSNTLLTHNMCNQSGTKGFIVWRQTCSNDSTSLTNWESSRATVDAFFMFLSFFFLDTDLFSFSRRARVHWSCSLSWCSRWASSMCCPQGDSWSRAGLEWRRRYWSSSLSPPHRRQHTEPPAHSHQQHKAEPRTTRGGPKHGRAAPRKGITGRETMKRDRPEWNETLWEGGVCVCACQIYSPIILGCL